MYERGHTQHLGSACKLSATCSALCSSALSMFGTDDGCTWIRYLFTHTRQRDR